MKKDIVPGSDEIYQFNPIRTDSRVLANHDESKDVCFTLFEFMDKGASRKMATWRISFGEMKNQDSVRNMRLR